MFQTHQIRYYATVLLVSLPLAASSPNRTGLVHGQDLEDEGFELGLVGRYIDAAGNKCQRIDRTLSFVWDDHAPDARLGPGTFRATWQGYLMSQARGTYQLLAYVQGELQIILNGKLLLDASSSSPEWREATPVDLSFDWHALEVRYRKSGANAVLSLYWSGPKFQLEPIGPRTFYHDRRETPPSRFERGELLVRALRCAACHQVPGHEQLRAAPSLDKLAGSVHFDWLVDWLDDSHHQVAGQSAAVTARRMPSFGFSRAQAVTLASYLRHRSDKQQGESSGPSERSSRSGDPDLGKKLCLTLGCLACHRLGELGTSNLFAGGDLSHIAAKRPVRFFAEWLAQPAELNVNHRMPVFELTEKERHDLAAFLATCKSDVEAQHQPPPPSAEQNDRTRFREGEAPAREGEAPAEPAVRQEPHPPFPRIANDHLVRTGEQLFRDNQCLACHASDSKHGRLPSARHRRLTADSDWESACTGSPHSAPARPGYRLSASDVRAIREYVSDTSKVPQPVIASPDGLSVLTENNCLGCHSRDGAPGIASILPQVLRAHGELAALRPALSPPSLNSVGDKLRDDALVGAIRRKDGTLRPWLQVRMPIFNLSDTDLAALVRHLKDADRIPAGAPHAKQSAPRPTTQLAGRRLVTADGFGCTSCHAVGSVKPPQAPLNTLGANLSMLGRRIRYAWFDRWVRNPARIVPRMEMPSLEIPVRGVLGDDLEKQLVAVWNVLNQPGFQPPTPNAVRVVRRSGIAQHNQRAAILTDVVQVGKRTFIRPFLIGLRNRHNMLIDLQSNQLARWWIGDVARQRTRGKAWFWEVAGEELLSTASVESELTLLYQGQTIVPSVTGQFVTEVDRWKSIAGGVEFAHRLRFAGSASDRVVLSVRQQLLAEDSSPHTSSTTTGVRRVVHVAGLPAGYQARWRVLPTRQVSDAIRAADGRQWTLPGDGNIRIQLVRPVGVSCDDEGFVILTSNSSAEPIVLELRYLVDLDVDQFPVMPSQVAPPPPVAMDVVPGFGVTRLPIVDELMPTALAWRPDGTLIVASLKGRVWLARDTDDDGLEDRIAPFSDELAAPYGVAAAGDHIDVINKYALLRLVDLDDDGQSDQTVTLASGWAHTDDYHDWAVGLPRDESGNYYVALPCQQDERSPAAAHLRGKVIKLVRRQPSPLDPRPYTAEQISGGHRFPMGIARRRDGALFVTDNQGNYNPFNELNHVISGASYGFINALEQKTGFHPPLTSPSINIPHPWTRSVNGICFLETPDALAREGRHDIFGPFEGHLVGCEYDTRRLIRMSLQRVGDTYQGAVYPLSRQLAEEETTLLGPICCAISPHGELYIGCLRDSGWGGANNIGTLVRMQPRLEELPAGVAEVRALQHGFAIDFTKAVDRELAANVDSYSISSYTRISTPAYGGHDVDRRVEKVTDVRVDNGGMRVTLRLSAMRPGYVYEFHLKNLAPDHGEFFPAEAHFTLRQLPDG